MAFYYRCRKCWDDVELKKHPKEALPCEACGDSRYFHAFGKTSERPKDETSERNSAEGEERGRRFSDG